MPGLPTVNNIVNHQSEDDGLDAILSALANRHRREIVDLLALQPASILQLSRRVGLSLPAIHRHIGILEEAGLVRRKKSGRVTFLAIRRSSLLRLQDWVQGYQASWGSDAETLETYVAAIERAERDRPAR